MTVPYTFATATTSIPLSQLDSNFATAITLGNTAVYLGNTTTSIGNLTLTGATVSATSISYSTTLTGGTGIVNLGSGQFYKDASGNVGIGTVPSLPLDISSTTGNIRLTSSTGTNYAQLQVINGSGTTRVGVESSGGGSIVGGSSAYSTVLSQAGAYSLHLGTNNTIRATIDASGNMLLGTTTVNGVGTTFINQAANAGAPYIALNKSYSGAATALNFAYNGAQVGSIVYSDTATSFNTSSDYRLKENVQPMTDALAKVAALKPVTYTWKSNGSDGQGFIAHELQDVVPDCVTGEKDAVDKDGKPKYQGIDTSFLVATLTAAIQEQQAMIAQLQSDVAALKGN